MSDSSNQQSNAVVVDPADKTEETASQTTVATYTTHPDQIERMRQLAKIQNKSE